MNTHSEVTGNLTRRRLMARVIAGGVILLGLIAATLLLQGCGGEKSASSSGASEPASQPVLAEPADVVAASSEGPAVMAAQPPAAEPAGGLPPEIALREIDTHVTPGQAITIIAEATPGVTEVVLYDGFGDPQALVRDPSGDNTWSVGYRVPLRPREERFGLSVTARDEHRRWRRVWLFLEVQKPAGFVQVEVDSAARP